MISIIMGSVSDMPVMSAAALTCEEFGVPHDVTIVSAHRTPERMVDVARNAVDRGVTLFIAGAGGAAHLPGMVAALTDLPVIGVPVKGSFNDGLDALLSIVQMPRGVPVATVGVNNARNAALLALRIRAMGDPALREQLRAFRERERIAVEEQVERIASAGWRLFAGDDGA